MGRIPFWVAVATSLASSAVGAMGARAAAAVLGMEVADAVAEVLGELADAVVDHAVVKFFSISNINLNTY